METVPQITFRDFSPTEALSSLISDRCNKLEEVFDRVVGCHVVLSMPHRHHRQGKRFHVRVDVSVPGGEIVVNRAPSDEPSHEDPYVAVEDAFDDALRLLQAHAKRIRGDVKSHESRYGRVGKLFRDRGYGFVETQDGREIYFHQNAVLGGHFDKLDVGDAVRFAEEDGENGPQASTLALSHKHPASRAARETSNG